MVKVPEPLPPLHGYPRSRRRELCGTGLVWEGVWGSLLLVWPRAKPLTILSALNFLH